MLKRHMQAHLARSATRLPIVTVMGPRQSGKTTLVRAVFPDRPYVPLELSEERAWTRRDRHAKGLQQMPGYGPGEAG